MLCFKAWPPCLLSVILNLWHAASVLRVEIAAAYTMVMHLPLGPQAIPAAYQQVSCTMQATQASLYAGPEPASVRGSALHVWGRRLRSYVRCDLGH